MEAQSASFCCVSGRATCCANVILDVVVCAGMLCDSACAALILLGVRQWTTFCNVFATRVSREQIEELFSTQKRLLPVCCSTNNAPCIAIATIICLSCARNVHVN